MTWETIINYTIGILGLILAYYFYRRSVRIKEPVYSIKSNNLISDYSSKYQHLKISYNRKQVENLTVSKVLFYNRGAETITQEDIATKNRPRIIAKESVRILDASILQINNTSSDFVIPAGFIDSSPLSEGKEVIIWFTYLDKNQGAVYQIIHTGSSSNDIDVVGDIIGVEKIVKTEGEILQTDSWMKLLGNRFFHRFLYLFIMTAIVLVVAGNVYAMLFREEALQFRLSIDEWIYGDSGLVITTILYILLAYGAHRMVRFLLGSKVSPKGLEKFEE